MSTTDWQSFSAERPVAPSAPARGFNKLAIVSLVVGILWVGGLGAILALILGIVGLKQIKRSGQRGKGLAIAGIVLGCLGVLTLIVVSVTFTQ